MSENDTARPDAARRRTWIIAGAVAAVVIVAVVLALVFVPRGSEDPGMDPVATGDPTATTTDGATPTATSGASEAPVETPVVDNPFPELAPVAPDQTVSTEGLEVALVRFESVQGEVVGPGEVAGAALRVTVSLTNTSGSAFDLDYVVVNAYTGDERDPAETYEQPGGAPVSGSLESGATAEGVYLFRIPEDRRGDVTIVVDYAAGKDAVVFRGQVP